MRCFVEECIYFGDCNRNIGLMDVEMAADCDHCIIIPLKDWEVIEVLQHVSDYDSEVVVQAFFGIYWFVATATESCGEIVKVDPSTIEKYRIQ